MEVWKDIEGYEGFYQVSNLGRVRGLDRYVNDKRYGKRFKKGTIFTPCRRKRGQQYLAVILTKDCIAKTHSVHRLVAKAFIPNPDNKSQVNHLDEDPTNNRVDNLEWATSKENLNYNGRQQRIEQPKKKRVNAYDKQGNLVYSFESIREAGRHGFSREAISHHLNGKAKSSGGYVWKIAE